MLNSLNIDGIPCFNGTTKELGELTPATFIFGPNGSGKTSISRRLADALAVSPDNLGWGDGHAALQD